MAPPVGTLYHEHARHALRFADHRVLDSGARQSPGFGLRLGRFATSARGREKRRGHGHRNLRGARGPLHPARPVRCPGRPER